MLLPSVALPEPDSSPTPVVDIIDVLPVVEPLSVSTVTPASSPQPDDMMLMATPIELLVSSSVSRLPARRPQLPPKGEKAPPLRGAPARPPA